MKIAVIFGGTSSESEASSLNATYINECLKLLGHETVMIEFGKDIFLQLKKEAPKTVFLCVQGKGHGDGTLQGILDYLEISYTGSKRESATIINNKIICQKLFTLEGIPIANNFIWTQQDHLLQNCQISFLSEMEKAGIDFPCIIKAPTQGGSFGIVYLESISDYELIHPIFTYDDSLLVENFVVGKFYTVGLIEYKKDLLALPIMEGIAVDNDRKFTSFIGEYTAKEAQLPHEIQMLMKEFAKRAFQCVGASGYARVDFILDEVTLVPVLLEINAVPGLKPKSLFPPAAKLAGIEYKDMISAIISSSLNNTSVSTSAN